MDFVQAIVSMKPHALKFALNGLHQNRQCLIAAGIWDRDFDEQKVVLLPSVPQDLVTETTGNPVPRKRIVLSTRFSLEPKSSSQATEFTVLLKQHPYIRENNFIVYSPNAFDKSTCDPEWTRFDWPCRGTYQTCQFDPPMKVGIPTTKSCWRYSFRHQLDEAKRSQGFMIQLIENIDNSYAQAKLGAGQAIERDMAKKMNVKVFEVYAPYQYSSHPTSNFQRMDSMGEVLSRLMPEIQTWYQHGCKDMCVVTTSGGGLAGSPLDPVEEHEYWSDFELEEEDSGWSFEELVEEPNDCEEKKKIQERSKKRKRLNSSDLEPTSR